MIFIGRSPISFKNIKHVEIIKSYELANILRKNDIYITGSKNDPCSNSLIEALTCGLPCVVLNDGGHPEILKGGGELFNTFDDCLKKIQIIKENYELYRKKIQFPTINNISNQYINFIKNLILLCSSGKYHSNKLSKLDYTIAKVKFNLFNNSNIKKLIRKFHKTIYITKKT